MATAPAMPRTAPVKLATILALRGQGLNKSQIAKRLGMSRNSVAAYLATSQVECDPEQQSAIIPKLTDLAYSAVNEGLTDTKSKAIERGRLGIDWLKLNAEHERAVRPVRPELTVALGLLVPGPQPQPSTSNTVSTGTEAPAKAGVGAIAIASPTNFSPTLASASIQELEAELARRRATVIEAEVTDVPGEGV